jgi:succinate dehydrogenase hydrophobic anchor subunit
MSNFMWGMISGILLVLFLCFIVDYFEFKKLNKRLREHDET